MYLVLHDGLRNPKRVRATRIVVEDDFGNPIGIFLQVEPNHVIAEVADNEESFNKLLRSLGVNRTLVIDTVECGPEDRLRT